MKRHAYRKFVIYLLLPLIVFCVCALAAHHLLFTTNGSMWLVKKYIKSYIGCASIQIGASRGSLSGMLSLDDIVIKNLKELPEGSTLKIRRFDARLPLFRLEDARVAIQSGKLELSDNQSILFHGKYENSELSINLFLKDLRLRTLEELTDMKDAFKPTSGIISSADLYVKGQLSEPRLTGDVEIARLEHWLLMVSDCKASLNLEVKGLKDKPLIYGDVKIKKCTLLRPRLNVKVEILRGILKFNGDPATPAFDISGKTNIDDVNIFITLTGNMEMPNLKVSSQPEFPEERILLMLATGKSWKGIDASLKAGKISPELMKDFFDFFVFSGSSNEISEHYGVDVSVKYDGGAKGIGAGYKVTNDITVEAHKEVIQEDKGKTEQNSEKKADDNVVIKYKRDF